VRDFLLATAWLATLALAGFLLVRPLLSPSWGAARLALGYGLGLALLTFLLALASLAGLPLGSETVLAITLLLLGSNRGELLWSGEAIGLPDEWPRGKPRSKTFRPDPWPGIFVLLALLAAFFSFGQGFHATDELILWGVKGYGIATDGAIRSVTQWGTNTVAYPLHIPLGIAASSLLLGQALPAAKLIFPAYALALLCCHEARGSPAAHDSAPALAAIPPLVFQHGTLAYANLSELQPVCCGSAGSLAGPTYRSCDVFAERLILLRPPGAAPRAGFRLLISVALLAYFIKSDRWRCLVYFTIAGLFSLLAVA
jgi:hypothetical protein